MKRESSKGSDSLIDKLMFWGLCGLFFFIPVSTSPAVISGGIVIGLWLVSGRFVTRTGWLRRKWTVPVIALMALPWAGLLYTSNTGLGLGFALKSHYWLYALAMTGISLTALRFDSMMKAYLAGVSFTSVLFITQAMGLVPMRPPYSVGLLNRWAHISFSLLLAFSLLVLSFYFRRAEGKRQKAVWLSLMLLNFISLSLLLSDSGHLALILLSPFIAYNLLGTGHVIKIMAVSALIIGALFLSPVTQSRLNEAVSGTDAYGKGVVMTPVGLRYYMWTGGLKIFLEHPLIGVGTGGYQDAMKKHKATPDFHDPVQPHNSFLYMAVSHGLPGLLVLVWLFWIVLKDGWKSRETLTGFSALAFTLVLIIGSLTDTQILQVHTAALFSVLTGLSGEAYG